MKVLVCLMLICVSWVTNQNLNCNCGRTNMKKIFNGKTTYKNDYPWMVHLNNGCGGSIITEYHVLTAAHCTDKKEPEDIQVYVGMGFRNKEKNENMIKYGVSRIDQHEGFKSDTLENDISILVISKRIAYNKFIAPVCLPHTPFRYERKLIRITGLGEIKDSGDDEVDVKDINIEKCKGSWSKAEHMTRICAYTLGNDSCTGSSGGGLVYQDPDTERYTQVAVVSIVSEECGNDSKPSVNTYVFAFVDWIQQVVARSQPGTNLCKQVLRKQKAEAGWKSWRNEKSIRKREDKHELEDENFSSGFNLSNSTFLEGAEIENVIDPLKNDENNTYHADDSTDPYNSRYDFNSADNSYPLELSHYSDDIRHAKNRHPILANISSYVGACPIYPKPCPGKWCPPRCPPYPCCCPGYYPKCPGLCPPLPPFECPKLPCCCRGFFVSQKHVKGALKCLISRLVGIVIG